MAHSAVSAKPNRLFIQYSAMRAIKKPTASRLSVLVAFHGPKCGPSMQNCSGIQFDQGLGQLDGFELLAFQIGVPVRADQHIVLV